MPGQGIRAEVSRLKWVVEYGDRVIDQRKRQPSGMTARTVKSAEMAITRTHQ